MTGPAGEPTVAAAPAPVGAGAMAAALARYLGDHLAQPGLHVTALRRIPGGASRHTYSVEVAWPHAADGAGGETPLADPAGSVSRRLIVRLDPQASLLESNRAAEYALYRAMADVEGVPVPATLLQEDDPGHLGGAFFVMEHVTGSSAGPEIAASPHRDAVAGQMFDILAGIGGCDWRGLGLGAVLAEPAADEVWARELDRWEAVLDAHPLGPLPVTRATVRWLRRNPPPPPQRVALVHGDFRVGNVLVDQGRVTAVLDWELSHLGDPVEDLCWFGLENWRYDPGNVELAGGLLDLPAAAARWESATGLAADPRSVRWWTLLSQVKAVAIWVTGGHNVVTGRTSDPFLALIPWLYVSKQEAWMLAGLAGAGVLPARLVPAAGAPFAPAPGVGLPGLPQVLGALAGRLGALAVGDLDDYARADLMVLALLAATLAADAESGVAVCTAEAADLTSLLARGRTLAAATGAPTGLVGQLDTALAGAAAADPVALTRTGAQARLDGLQQAAVHLQAWAEELDDPGADELLATCWSALAAAVARRA